MLNETGWNDMRQGIPRISGTDLLLRHLYIFKPQLTDWGHWHYYSCLNNVLFPLGCCHISQYLNRLDFLALQRDETPLCVFYPFYHGKCAEELFGMIPAASLRNHPTRQWFYPHHLVGWQFTNKNTHSRKDDTSARWPLIS